MTKGDLYMKRRLMTELLVVVMIVSLAFPALAAQAYADALAAAEALIEAESTDAEANAAAQQALADAQNALTEKPAAEKFTDVPADAYYHDAVYALVEQGVINGMTADTLAPKATANRGQAATVLYRFSESLSA